MLDAGDLRQHLLGRRGDHLFHVPRRCAGEWDQHVRHRHVDLRLFLAWRDEHGEHAQEKGADRQQRRDLRRLEIGGDAAGYAERLAHVGRSALTGRGLRIQCDALTGGDAAQYLHGVVDGAPEAHLPENGMPIRDRATYTPVISARRTMALAGT